MVGSALDVRGGVSAVERVLLQNLPAGVSIAHIATMVDGGRRRKLFHFARALKRLPRQLRSADVVHIRFASGASSRRKLLVARAAMRRSARVILHAHGGYYRTFWKEMTHFERRYTLATLRRADGVVVLGDSGYRERDQAKLLENIRRKVPQSMLVEIFRVDTAERTALGKTPFVIHRPAVKHLLQQTQVRERWA